MGKGHRRRHQHIGLIAGIPEHQTLVACTLVFRLLTVDALGDVRRLLADDVDHTAGIAVVANVGGGVADVLDHIAHQVFQVNPGAGGDFTADDGDTGLDHGFAGNAGKFVFADDRVEYCIGDLIGKFVRMAFGDGFGGENGVIAHAAVPSVGKTCSINGLLNC